jgi:hypothetical protein
MSTKHDPRPVAGLQPVSSKPGSHATGKRVVGRPWPKGVSGNPSGKRQGTVSLASALKRELTPANASAIARRLIGMARRGNLQAIKLCFERLDGVALEERLEKLEAVFEQREVRSL